MKVRTTIILVLLTGALLAFIITKEQAQLNTREKLASEARPFQFKAEDADEIELERKDGTLRMVRRNGSWRIEQPFDDAADPDLVKQLLEGIPAMEWVETVQRKDLRNEDFKRTGLGENSVKIRVRRSGATLAEAIMGAAAALEGCAYAALPGGKEELYVAKTSLLTLLRKNDDEWRDPRLARLKVEDIHHFTMSAGNAGMEFTRGPGGSWRLMNPIQTRASDDRVDAVIRGFLNLRVRPAKTAASPAASGPDLPVMNITLEGPRLAKPLLLKLHPNANPSGEVQVTTGSRDGTFLTSVKAAEFWKLQPNHLRDQNLVQIPKERTTALRIRSLANAEIVLDKQGERWLLTRFGKPEPANQQRVARLFDTLNSSPVREFLSDVAGNLEPWGLQQPFLSVEWEADGKKSILQFGQRPDGIITARLADEPFIYRVGSLAEKPLFNAIPPDSLRWRDTKLINVSIFAVLRIIVSEGDRPALTLLHNPNDATWMGNIAGRDVTAQLDKARANQLLDKLAGLQATDWNSDRGGALEALKNPSLTVQLLLANPANPSAEPKPVTLTFAPLQPGMDSALYHGRKDQEPDTFLISRDLYHELTAPMVK